MQTILSLGTCLRIPSVGVRQPCGPAGLLLDTSFTTTQQAVKKRWRRQSRRCQSVQAAFKSRTSSKATASDQVYLCIDCGWIYDGRKPFPELPKDYICPVCQAPKRRFKATKRPSQQSARRGPAAASGEGVDKNDTPVLVAGGVGILVVVAAVWGFLNSQF